LDAVIFLCRDGDGGGGRGRTRQDQILFGLVASLAKIVHDCQSIPPFWGLPSVVSKYVSGTALAEPLDALERAEAEGAGRFARYSRCESSNQEANCECQGVSKNSDAKSTVKYANSKTFCTIN
jgi:hypothetical protein